MPAPEAANPRLFSFVGARQGTWRILGSSTLRGDPLPTGATQLSVVPGTVALPEGADWVLRGAISNDRYVIRDEKTQLAGRQEGLGRANSTMAALIPIGKTAAW
jgi:hypothetical protein